MFPLLVTLSTDSSTCWSSASAATTSVAVLSVRIRGPPGRRYSRTAKQCQEEWKIFMIIYCPGLPPWLCSRSYGMWATVNRTVPRRTVLRRTSVNVRLLFEEAPAEAMMETSVWIDGRMRIDSSSHNLCSHWSKTLFHCYNDKLNNPWCISARWPQPTLMTGQPSTQTSWPSVPHQTTKVSVKLMVSSSVFSSKSKLHINTVTTLWNTSKPFTAATTLLNNNKFFFFNCSHAAVTKWKCQ